MLTSTYSEELILNMGHETINATLTNIMVAATSLTLVEFRMWIEQCKTFPNTHPSHYIDLEKLFVATGSWELEVDQNDLPIEKE